MSGVLARFEDHHALADAIVALRRAGYRELDAITPFEVHEVERALEIPRSRVPWVAAGVATVCGALALLVLWWTNAYDYRLDVGGRPYFSFWTDVPITFETTILATGVTGFVAFFVASKLPRLHHPWFSVEGTETGFWLSIDDSDPAFEDVVVDRLREAGATAVERFEGDAS